MLGVLVINLTCKDKRNSGNHDIEFNLPLVYSNYLSHQIDQCGQ